MFSTLFAGCYGLDLTMKTLVSSLRPFCACGVKCFMGAGEVLSPLVAFKGKGTRFHYTICPLNVNHLARSNELKE